MRRKEELAYSRALVPKKGKIYKKLIRIRSYFVSDDCNHNSVS